MEQNLKKLDQNSLLEGKKIYMKNARRKKKYFSTRYVRRIFALTFVKIVKKQTIYVFSLLTF